GWGGAGLAGCDWDGGGDGGWGCDGMPGSHDAGQTRYAPPASAPIANPESTSNRTMRRSPPVNRDQIVGPIRGGVRCSLMPEGWGSGSGGSSSKTSVANGCAVSTASQSVAGCPALSSRPELRWMVDSSPSSACSSFSTSS